MRGAFLVCALSAFAAPSAAQDRVALSIDACDTPWARFDTLAPLLRIELRTPERAIDVTASETEPATLLARVIDCGTPAALQLEAQRGNVRIEHRVDLGDVPEDARARTLALLLADLFRALPEASPPAAAPAQPHAAVALAHPSVAGEPDRAPPVEPSPPSRAGPLASVWAVIDLAIVVTDPQAFTGGRLGARVDLPGDLDAISLGAGLGVQGARGTDELGTIDLFLVSLAIDAALTADIAPLAIGGAIELRPSLVVASASGVRDSVTARSEIDVAIDLALLARVSWNVTDAFVLRLDAGVLYALRGYEARAADRRVVGWTEWAIPVRLAGGLTF